MCVWGGRDPGFLTFPKCVFLALKNFFGAKIDKESPKCTGEVVTGLGKIPRIYHFFYSFPYVIYGRLLLEVDD